MLVTAVVVMVATIVLYGVTPVPNRAALRAGLRAPVKTVAIALVTLVLPPLAMIEIVKSQPGPEALVVIVVMLWWLGFAARSVWLLAQSVLSIREVHPMLAPICGATAVALNALLALALGDTDGVPMDLWLLVTGGGVLSVAALGVIEYAQLHRYGVRLLS